MKRSEVGRVSMGDGYERIQTRIFDLDPISEYEELEQALKLGKSAHTATYAEIVDALDLAEDNARRAHALFCHARVELERFEIEVSLSESAMRESAQRALFEAKERGEFKKVISNDDVEAYMRTHNTDEYTDSMIRRQKAKRMVEHLERLADLWRKRRDTLDTMGNRAR